MESHILVHVPYYPFPCDYCERKFKRKYDRGKHIASIHSDAKTTLKSEKTSIEFLLN